MKSFLQSTLLLFLFTACATPPHKAIEELKIGMNKDDVIHKIGSPLHSTVKLGIDEWTYSYYIENKQHKKLLRFEKGLLIELRNIRQKILEKSDTSKSLDEYEKQITIQRKKSIKNNDFKNLDNE